MESRYWNWRFSFTKCWCNAINRFRLGQRKMWFQRTPIHVTSNSFSDVKRWCKQRNCWGWSEWLPLRNTRSMEICFRTLDKGCWPEKENWRRIIDAKNNSGWIHWSQLKRINSIILLEDKILFKNPSNFSKPIAKIKEGRLLLVQKCDGEWCKVKTEKIKGWIKKDNVWGLIN